MGLFDFIKKVVTQLPASNRANTPSRYIVFDIETTGFSRVDDRIIEIAANEYANGTIVNTFHSFVNPGRHIPNAVTRLTGIRDADVRDAPSILEIKREIIAFFQKTLLVGHNIKTFDIPFLEAQLGYRFSNELIDTLHLAKRVFPGLPSYKLSVLDQVLQLGSLDHHRAENDILANNALFIACYEPQKYMKRVKDPAVLNNLVIEQRTLYPDIDIHSFAPANPDAIPKTALTGKGIVFSGEFNLLREEMYQIAVDAGATLKSRVSRKVEYLVQGISDPRFVDECGMSSKQRTAEKLNCSGEANVKIITESEFLKLASPQN